MPIFHDRDEAPPPKTYPDRDTKVAEGRMAQYTGWGSRGAYDDRSHTSNTTMDVESRNGAALATSDRRSSTLDRGALIERIKRCQSPIGATPQNVSVRPSQSIRLASHIRHPSNEGKILYVHWRLMHGV